MSGDRPVLLLPGRIDAAIAGWLTMGLPLIDRLAGSSEGSDPSTVAQLARKVASPIGLVEIVPVRLTTGQAEPIASGYWPLGATREHRRLDSRARQQRRFSSRKRGHDKTVAMSDRLDKSAAGHDLIETIRRAARQEQFLEVVSAEEARARFARHVDLAPLPAERVALAASLGRVLAHDVTAPIDVPPFDRSNVDGFALRAADTVGASDTAPKRLRLNAEVVVCGHAPTLGVEPGTATTIATGGVVPRGADAVVMVEQTELVEGADAAIDVRRAAAPGQFISYAGSDIARGEVVLRRGARIGSREIGMLAACGIAEVDVVRRPRVAVLSTGDELVPPGEPLRPAGGLRFQRRDRRGGGAGDRRRAGAVRQLSRRRNHARARDPRRARHLRHGAAVGRHLEGRRRSLASRGVAARRARRDRARRRAQARQAALPRGGRRQAAGGAAGISDLGDLHLPCLRRAGDPRQGRACRRKRRAASRPRCRCAFPPSSAARNSCWSRWSRAKTGRSRSRPPRARAR